MILEKATYYVGTERRETQREIPAQKDVGIEWNVINVYPDVEYQTVLGFGGAVTEAAGVVYSKLNEESRKKLIEAYYGKDGNNYVFGRCSIDSCDFGLGNYSAKETEDASFSLDRDKKYILPLLDDIYRTKKIKLFMAPWSPPAYMKTNGEKNHGGKLKKEYYSAWAEYMCSYLSEYKKLGYDVFAVSTQNEPKATQRWDSCVYSTEEEADFLGMYLYPQMKKYGLKDIRRIVWDHNKERAYERLEGVYKSVSDKSAVSGVGYHWYSGDHFDALKLISEKYPDKLSVFTEGCVEGVKGDAGEYVKHAEKYAHEIIGCLNNGCNVFIDWNILLDEKGGPNHVGNFCEAPVMADGNGGIRFNPSYYAIRHFSKYLISGAKRIATTSFSKDVECTAWKNPDGKAVLVVLNMAMETIPLHIRLNGSFYETELKEKSIVTVILN